MFFLCCRIICSGAFHVCIYGNSQCSLLCFVVYNAMRVHVSYVYSFPLHQSVICLCGHCWHLPSGVGRWSVLAPMSRVTETVYDVKCSSGVALVCEISLNWNEPVIGDINYCMNQSSNALGQRLPFVDSQCTHIALREKSVGHCKSSCRNCLCIAVQPFSFSCRVLSPCRYVVYHCSL